MIDGSDLFRNFLSFQVTHEILAHLSESHTSDSRFREADLLQQLDKCRFLPKRVV